MSLETTNPSCEDSNRNSSILAQNIKDINISKDDPSHGFIILDSNSPELKNLSQVNLNIQADANVTCLLLHQNKAHNNTTFSTKINLNAFANLNFIECLIDCGASKITQHITLSGASSSVKSTVIFLGSKSDQIDVNTSIYHKAKKTSGNMLCRAVLLDNAKADFIAKITVPKGIVKTVSHQNMKCLTQGSKAKCDALPILDVNNDDVICSHGAAIGRVEDESLYYLESRGIPRNQAQRMLLKGFLMQELSSLPEKIISEIENKIQQKLVNSSG
jgi:Fe-S cluster assembly protein SufD